MNDFPLVLAHGIAPFDAFRQIFVERLHLEETAPDRLHYFRNIASHLRANGFKDVHHSRVSFAGSVEQRAQELKADVEGILAASGKEKVHIIAHSMGGLDSRYMVARLGMEPRVASVSTIGTPHRGTSLADWGQQHGGEQILSRFENVIDLSGFLNLTSDFYQKLSLTLEETEAGNRVFYQTYAAHDERENVFLPLRFSWDIIKGEEEKQGRDGRNDGLVPFSSQKWEPEFAKSSGKVKFEQHEFPVPADHLNEVGYWNPSQLRGKVRTFSGWNPVAWVMTWFRGRREYEDQIKGVYLEIAQNVTTRELPK